MTTFHKALRAFAAEKIAEPGDHKRREIADAFLDANPELAHEYVRDLAGRKVADLIKELCDERTADPLPLFSGFPVAITVSPGVVKASDQCDLNDLGAGLAYRHENVQHAQKKLDAYRSSMAAFESLRASEVETLGECQERLRKQGQIGGQS